MNWKKTLLLDFYAYEYKNYAHNRNNVESICNDMVSILNSD